MTHGTRAAYLLGCRCLPCRASNAAYECARSHDGYRYVSATWARWHLEWLHRAGVGSRQAARLAHVSRSVVMALRAGRRRHLRRDVEARILAIGPRLAPGQTVPGYRTRKLIDALHREGFDDKATLPARVGLRDLRGPREHDRVKARTAARVERVWRETSWMDEGDPCKATTKRA